MQKSDILEAFVVERSPWQAASQEWIGDPKPGALRDQTGDHSPQSGKREWTDLD